jgi:hypothetical protein
LGVPLPDIDSIRKRLWPQETGRDVWAILDGARERRIYGHVVDTYLESSCLYSGALTPELEVAAPYLVQLEYDDRLTRRILEQGWGNSWGIFLKSSTSLKKLRRHLREFLIVNAAGKRMLFRYYDPRVLRIYLPTCTSNELRTVFGPIETFWMESGDADNLLEFSIENGKLREHSYSTTLSPDRQER